MNIEIFDTVVNMFKNIDEILSHKDDINAEQELEDMIELAKMGIKKEFKNPYQFMINYFTCKDDIIKYFDSINEEWSLKYHYDRKQPSTDEGVKFPDIYIDFKNYVEKLNTEEYLECKKLRDKIFTY